jgi:hypothetical protein
MARTLSLTTLLLALAPLVASAAAPSPVPFDAQKHVYWCGQPLASPLALTLAGGQMRVNGLARRSLPSDTLRQEEAAQRVFGNVPQLQRMHVHGGYPYRSGPEALGWILGRMATRARGFYSRSLPQGAAQARAAGITAMDTSLVDVTQPITIDSTTIRFTPRGLTRPVEFSGKPPAIHGLQEMLSTDTDEMVEARAENVRKLLGGPGPAVLLMDEVGDTAITGQKAVEAESTIETLIARTKAGETVEYGPEHIAIGHRAFDLLVQAARHP